MELQLKASEWLYLWPFFWALVLYFCKGRRFAGNRRALVLLCLAALVVLLGLAQPQLGRVQKTSAARTSNLFLAIDVSLSMLAEDSSPSRIGLAKVLLRQLLPGLPGSRVALFPFALTGYLQLPLNEDLTMTLESIEGLDPITVIDQGSDLGQGLKDLGEVISQAAEEARAKNQAWPPTQVLLLSDGESHVPVPDSALHAFHELKIPIYTLGIGNPTPTPLPINPFQQGFRGLLRQNRGNSSVETQLHADTLKRISKATGGLYTEGTLAALAQLQQRLRNAQAFAPSVLRFQVERELFPYCFLVGFCCILLALLTVPWKWVLVPGLYLWLCPMGWAAERSGDPETLARESYNQGVQEGKNQRPAEAAEHLREALLTTRDPKLRKKTLLELGNQLAQIGDLEEAQRNYQQGRDLSTPDSSFDQEANRRFSANLELVARLQKEMAKKPKSGGNKQGKQSRPQDTGKKDYQGQRLSPAERERVYRIVSEEERETLARSRRDKAGSGEPPLSDKPW